MTRVQCCCLQMGMAGMAHPGLLPGMPGGPAMMPGGPGVSPAGNGRMDLFPHMAQPPVGMQQMPAAHQQVLLCAGHDPMHAWQRLSRSTCTAQRPLLLCRGHAQSRAYAQTVLQWQQSA